MRPRKAHFLKAIRGFEVSIKVQFSETDVFISQKEAMRLFTLMTGDIAWAIDGGVIALTCNASDRLGCTGNIEDERMN